MSWGERSCKNKPCPIPEECNIVSCNVNCKRYEWDGVTKPDSETIKELGEYFLEPKVLGKEK